MDAHSLSPTLAALEQRDDFIGRHIGPSASDIAAMLASIGASSMEQLVEQTIPATIRLATPLALAEPRPESEALAALRAIAGRNRVQHSLIGMGYSDTLTPAVVLRNVLENPGWYTAYTPYQAEVAQGRLEALLNYQQMVIDLTGLELANASLLDEATAAAEAMSMARRVSKSKSNLFFVDAGLLPADHRRAPDSRRLLWLRTGLRSTGRGGATGGLRCAVPVSERSRRNQRPERSDRCRQVTRRHRCRRLRPDGAWYFSARRAKWAPTSLSDRHSVSASRSVSVVRMPHSSPPGTNTSARSPAASSAYPSMPAASRRCAWHCKPANSTSVAKRPTRISAPRRSARQHGRHVRHLSRPAGPAQHRRHASTASPQFLPKACGVPGITVLTRHFFDTLRVDLGSRALIAYQAASDAGYNLRQVAPGVLGIAVNEKTTATTSPG
jgi:glycine dehydrogenase